MRRLLRVILVAILIPSSSVALWCAQQSTTPPPSKTTSPGTQGTPARKRSTTKPPAPVPVPDTPEVIFARQKQACAGGDFKTCLQLHELVKQKPELIASVRVPPDSVPIQAATPELLPGMTWTYRLLSVDPAFDDKRLEVTLAQQDKATATFRLRLDGNEEQVQVKHEGAKYFAPQAEKAGRVAIVAETVLPDICSKNADWSASGSRRGIIEGGRIVGWVQETPGRSASGPVLHNAPGGASPAAVVFVGDTRMILTPSHAFAAQVLTAAPGGTRLLFNLVSVKQPDGREQTTAPLLESAAWKKVSLWMKENAIPGDFERTTISSLVAHVNERPDMQFVMIGGSQLSKSGKGVCVLWGHNGVVAESCDAQAFNVEPNRSVSFVVP